MNSVCLLLVFVVCLKLVDCDVSDVTEYEDDDQFYADVIPKNTTSNNSEFDFTIEFTKKLTNITEKSDKPLKLRCDARLSDSSLKYNETQSISETLLKKLKIRWLKNEAPISTDRKEEKRITIKKTILNGTVSSILKIKKLEIHDKAYYSCIAGIGKNQIRSNSFVIVHDIIEEEDRDEDEVKVIIPSKPLFNTNSPNSPLPSISTDIFSSPTHSYDFINRLGSTPIRADLNTDQSIPISKIHATFDKVENKPPLQGICQTYAGLTCSTYLKNQSVYIPYPLTQSALEDKLTSAFNVISYSKEISSNCRGYALPSLCFSTFPICRTPEETNKLFFEVYEKLEESKNQIHKLSRSNDMNEDTEDEEKSQIHFENLPPGGLPPHLDPNHHRGASRSSHGAKRKYENMRSRRQLYDLHFNSNLIVKTISQHQMLPRYDRHTQLPDGQQFELSRSSIPLRRVCREDCEILENEICQKEYAIAKRHPEIGQKLTLEECINLPLESSDCLEIGIEKHVGVDDTCYWETGVYYRGSVHMGITNLPCMKWAQQMKYKMNTFPELSGGHNYCRNPGGEEAQPWCIVEGSSNLEKQLCDVPKCSQKIWIYIISCMVGICVVFTSFLSCICCRHRNSKSNTAAIRNINVPNADKNIYGNSRLNSPIELSDLLINQSSHGNNSSRTNGILRVPQYMLSQIRFVEELGEGAFGKVYKGELTNEHETVYVAVKALKENASPKTQLDFRREIELISELRHENIVCILGVVLREEPLCMLFEFMAKGDLHEFLMKRAPPKGSGLSPIQFMSIAQHIAAGMEYLSAHHYVHRDLAARNCLVADNLTVKISDFGLSRDIYSSDYYRVQTKSLLPVRWMPPESILYGKFTTESDVWSYGVVLWEIYSYGVQPYYGFSNQEVITMVRNRELLECPTVCPRAVYSLMRECWHQTAARRPNFTTITNRLTGLMHPNSVAQCDTTSDSSGAMSHHRAPPSIGDPRERMPLIGHHSSSNGSLAGSMPRKLSTAGSVRSHASARLMMSSSDVTTSSDNCESSMRAKKSSCGSLLDGQPSSAVERSTQRDTIVKIPTMSQPYDI